MNVWCLLRLVAFAVGLTCLLAKPARAEDPCAPADALRAAKLYTHALAAYADVLKKDASLPCARTGIDAIAQARAQAVQYLEIGKAYEASNQPTAARDAYVQALGVDPLLSEAQTALARVLAPVSSSMPEKLAHVHTLTDLGLYTAATEELREVLKTDKTVTVTGGLPYRLTGTVPPFERVVRWIDPLLWVGWRLGGFVIVGLLIWMGGYGVLSRIWPWWKGRNELRLHIQDFDQGVTDLDIGKGLAALVEESVKQFPKQGTQSGIGLLTGPAQTFVLPAEVTATTPQLTLISSLLAWLFPPHVITLSGCVQESSENGAGLTLILGENRTGNSLAEHTIWQKLYDPGMTHVPKEQLPFIHLTETAAIWVLYTLDGYRHRGATVSPVSRFTPLGVTQWQSYAAFRAGVHWQQDGQTDKAHSLYQHALQLDAKNRGALLDLGILETKDKHYDQALEHLQEAQQAAIAAEQAYRAGEKFHTDTVWYVATYQLAATYDYMDMPRRWQQAKEQARSLVDMVKQADALLAHPRPVVKSDLEARYAEEDQQLATFLKRIKPLTMLLYASILVRGTTADDREQAERLMMEIAPGELKDPRVQYNLAACYSRKGQAVTAQARTDAYTQALQHLDLAFACATRDARQRLVSWARVDPSFDGVRDGMYDQFLRLVNKYTS